MKSAVLGYTQAIGAHSSVDALADAVLPSVPRQQLRSSCPFPRGRGFSWPALPPLESSSAHYLSQLAFSHSASSIHDRAGRCKTPVCEASSGCQPNSSSNASKEDGRQHGSCSCLEEVAETKCRDPVECKADGALTPGAPHVGRRNLAAAVGALGLAALSATPAQAAEALLGQPAVPAGASSRRLNLVASTAEAPPDTTITARAYFDFSLCPTAFRPDRTLGDMSLICDDGEPMGRIVIGLYGKQVPQTVENFKAMVTGAGGSSYKGTIIHKILQGQYFQGGRQGALDKGEVAPPRSLPRNPETIQGSAFQLAHSRPGTVSLCLGTNDDDDDRKLDAEYRNVEFLITTGPGPAPQLDNGNIVFGTVLEGMDVVSRIASVPTNRPSERIRQFNEFAEFLGDDRASKGRTSWNRPLKSVVIQSCGLLPA